jgi:hypothetical protein
MDPNHQHLFIVTSVEDTDPTPFGKGGADSPEEIVVQFPLGGLLERRHLAPLRIDPPQDCPDGGIFPGCVHGLKDQEDTPPIVGIKLPLQVVQAIDRVFQIVLELLFSRSPLRWSGGRLANPECPVERDQIGAINGFKHVCFLLCTFLAFRSLIGSGLRKNVSRPQGPPRVVGSGGRDLPLPVTFT